MFKHYFKTAWRNLKADKLFSVLNITGLSIGIAAALLIFIWVESEYNYNKKFSKHDDIFLAENTHVFNGQNVTYKTTSPLLAPEIKQQFPQIKYAARSVFYPNILLSTTNDKIYKDGAYADADFFKIFNLQFVEGSAGSALKNINDIVLTQSTAKVFFGNGNAVGKTLKLNNGVLCNVSAVIKDFPLTSSFQYNWIANFKSFGVDLTKETWTDNYLETYVKLNSAKDVFAVNQTLKDFIVKRDKEANAHPFLYSIRKLHLYSSFVDGKVTGNGNIKYVRMFAVAAFIILLIACINFMNLSTARSLKRSKEISVRKVFGADKKSLLLQFFSEAFFCSGLATAFAVVAVVLLFPFFKQLMQLSIDVHYFTFTHIAAVILTLLICTLLAGAYPALYLSSFDPAQILRKQHSSRLGGGFIRKGLVVFQFATCIILLIATIVIHRQIAYTQKRNVGFQKNNVIYTTGSDYLKSTDLLKNKLLSSGVVKNVSFGYGTPIGIYNSGSGFYWEGKDVSKNIDIANTEISSDYFSTFGIQLLTGRDFLNDGKDSNSVVINQALADIMGNEGRIGGRLYSKGGSSNAIITGIVKDFVFDDMNAVKSKPLVYRFDKEHYGQIFISLKESHNISQPIATIKKIYEKIYPSSSFAYKFLDEDFKATFEQEVLVNKLSALFGVLAVFVSCLGLFGLSSFMAEARKKEIGIRKVLGASVFSVTKLLTKDYLKLVVAAAFVGAPVAWMLMNSWLNGYGYRIHIEVWEIATVIVLSLLIALVTVASQAIRAARGNPVKSLKTE